MTAIHGTPQGTRLTPLRARWRSMRAVESHRDRYASLGVLAFGAASAAVAAVVHFVL